MWIFIKLCILAIMGYIRNYYDSSGDMAYRWAAEIVANADCKSLLDVGCGTGSPHLLKYMTKRPEVFCGVEMHPANIEEARKKGIDVKTFDLNGKWPYEDSCFEIIHGTQVIEHIHNTRQFLLEIFRVLEPGGTAVLTSENLCSLLNLSAMILGYTPFSLQNTCGWFVGNPFGLHNNETSPSEEGAMQNISSPYFSGITGHIRVLSVSQARQLMEKVGFVNVEVKSIGMMPLPAFIGRPLEKIMYRRGHWLMMKGSKPHLRDGSKDETPDTGI